MNKAALRSFVAAAAALALAPALVACSDPHRPSGQTAGPSSAVTASSAGPIEAPPRPASAAELAIFAPIAPGAKLADHDVREVRVARGVIEVVCVKGPGRVILIVAAASPGGPAPPVSTERYAVFYSVRGSTVEEAEQLAKSLADILKKNDAAPPPGLGQFEPRPRSL